MSYAQTACRKHTVEKTGPELSLSLLPYEAKTYDRIIDTESKRQIDLVAKLLVERNLTEFDSTVSPDSAPRGITLVD
jgi:hypothetical protein